MPKEIWSSPIRPFISCHIDIIAIAKPQIVVLLYVQLQCFLRLENDRFSKKSTDYA